MNRTSLSIRGWLGTGALPLVLRDLWRARASGTLVLSNGTTRKRIVFDHGDIVFAGTNLEEERLGERLVRTRRIKRRVRDFALQVMERSRERFGTTMVEWGWIDRVELRQHVRIQIREIIDSVLGWRTGEYRFERAGVPVESDLALPLATAGVIYEGARRISDLAIVRAGVGSASKVIKLAGGDRSGIPVTQVDRFILSRIDGSATIETALVGNPFQQEDTLRRLYALVLAGVIELVEPRGRDGAASSDNNPEARYFSGRERRFRDDIAAWRAALRFGSLYDHLRVRPEASETEIRRAYLDALTSLEPEPQFRHQIADLQPVLTKVEGKLRHAYGVLSVPSSRLEYDRLLSADALRSTLEGTRNASETQAASKTVSPESIVLDSVDEKE